MLTSEINFIAVIVATIANMAIGFVWYARSLFGKTWMALVGINEETAKKGAAKASGAALVMGFLTSYVMAIFVEVSDAATWQEGAAVGFWIWLGFLLTTVVTANVFAGKPGKLSMIVSGNLLVTMLVMGGILGGWQ